MSKSPRRFRAAVLGFFLASGATGLVLEVVWTRILGTVFGNTVYAASTVLTAFMLGLALGSAVLGRLADRVRRPLVLYGCLEIGVGLYALLLPVLAEASCEAYGWVFRSGAGGVMLLNVARVGLSVLLLLPPTFLMGGTLPVLGRHLGARHDRPGQQVGYLYGANTLGAVAGCFLAGFVLLELLGVRWTVYAAAGAAAGVGLLAVVLGRLSAAAPTAPGPAGGAPRRAGAEPDAPAVEALPVGTFRWLLAAYGVAGFCALAAEVLWTRMLIFVLSTSVYAFAAMLTTFLAGLAAGSWLSSRLLVPRVRRGLLWFGAIELGVGLSVLASVPLIARLEGIDFRLSEHLAWAGRWQAVAAHFADATVVFFVPTLLMGAAFPIVVSCCLRGAAQVGRRVGQVYAANTVGCVLGAFAAGFLLLPAVGTHYSLVIVAAGNLAVAVVLVWRAGWRSRWVRLGAAGCVAAVAAAGLLLTPPDVFHRTINAFHHPSRIAFLEEHATGTVTVHDLPNGERLLAVDGVNVAGLDFMLRSTQKLQGYLPLLLHPAPRRVVQIGFGSGETARVGLAFGVEAYTVVEICPAVFRAGRLFEGINAGSWRDPQVRRVVMDGKNFARLSGEKFDLVMNDATYPGSSGCSALYTVDHFRNCRRRLAPGGMLSCWVPLDLRPRELRMILRSFREVFPHCSLWLASNCVNKHALILGSPAPLRVDFDRVRRAMGRPEVAADLRAIAIHNAYDLLDCHLCDEHAIRRLVESDPLNTDDRPLLEFSCAIPIGEDRTLGPVLAMLAAHHEPVAPYLVNVADPVRDPAELERRFRATRHVFHAQVGQLLGDPKVRSAQFALALRANPDEVHVASCQAELKREIRDLRAALADRPRSALLAMRLAGKLYVGGRYDEAGALYERLARLDPPPHPDVLVRAAEIRFRRGRHEEAGAALCRCLALWPKAHAAHDRLAGIYLRDGKLDLARRHIGEAVRLAPGNSLYRDHQERILGAAGRSVRPVSLDHADGARPLRRE